MRWRVTAAGLVWLISGIALAQQADSELPETVVTATRIETPIEQVGSSISVVTSEEIKDRQVRYVSDVLRDVPGLQVNRAGGPGTLTEVRIRGAEANQTLVLIDGIEVNNPASGSAFDFGSLLAWDIERIEVLRGPQSALWGSDAIGGVVNIITKKATRNLQGAARAEGGSFGTWQGAGSMGSQGERYNILMSGTILNSTGISAADENQGNTEKDGVRNRTAFLKGGVQITDNLEIDAVGRYTSSFAQTDAFQGGVGAIDADEDQDITEWYGRAVAKLSLLDGAWEHKLGGFITDTSTDSRADQVENFSTDGRRSRIDYQTSYFFDTPKLGSANHTITFYYEHESERATTESPFSQFDRSVDSNGYVLEYDLGVWESLYLTGAGRYETNDMFDDAGTYRFTGAYLFQESGTRLHTSVGKGVKNPTLFELFGFTNTFQGNPNLKPEESIGWDAGVEQTLFDSRVKLDATYFQNRIQDLIVGAGETAINLDGTSRVQGVEFTASTSIMDGLDLSAAYTYVSSEDADGERLVRRPDNIASLNLNYRFLNDAANTTLTVRYTGSRDDLFFDENFNATTVTLPSYTVVNINGAYKAHKDVELFARIDNLFD